MSRKVVRIQSRICAGGPALHTILLSEGLSAASGSRYDTVLVSGQLEPSEKSMAAFAHQHSVNIHTIPSMQRRVRPHLDVKAVFDVSRLLRKERPDVVHTHTAKAGAVGRMAAWMNRTPVIVHTFHGHVFDGYFSKNASSAFVRTERVLSSMSDVIITISKRMKYDLVHKYKIAPEEKVRVIPLGLDLEPFRAVHPEKAQSAGVLRTQLGLSPDVPLVITAGRLVPIKRFDRLIRAFAQLKDAVPDAHLAIIGEGELRAQLEKQAEDVGSNVHFVGHRTDMPQMMADADVFCLSSDNEGTPVAVIEAMSAGLRVVATDVGGVKDVVEPEAGVVVACEDTDGLVNALRCAIQAEARIDETVRDTVTTRFSHHRLIRDIENLYDELLDAKTSRAWGTRTRTRTRTRVRGI